jgi:hypothetical protein
MHGIPVREARQHAAADPIACCPSRSGLVTLRAAEQYYIVKLHVGDFAP